MVGVFNYGMDSLLKYQVKQQMNQSSREGSNKQTKVKISRGGADFAKVLAGEMKAITV